MGERNERKQKNERNQEESNKIEEMRSCKRIVLKVGIHKTNKVTIARMLGININERNTREMKILEKEGNGMEK